MRASLLFMIVSLAACQGEVSITAYGERFVEDGIPASEVSDGWRIDFEEFVLAITDVSIDGDERIDAEGWFVFDLAQPSAGAGHGLSSLVTSAGSYDQLEYRLAVPERADGGNASEAQVDRLIREGATLQVRGSATRDGEALRFDWSFAIDQGHTCELDEQRGGRLSALELTIHADHLLLDDFFLEPQPAFDLIASADNDGDAMISNAELSGVDLSTQTRYWAGDDQVDDLYRYIGTLALTMGHVNGEGQCAPQFVPRRYRDLYEGAEIDDLATANGAAELYAQHCTSCHGPTGAGDGPAAEGLSPRPTDLRGLSFPTRDPAYLHFRIAEGGGFFPYASAMPGLGAVLDPQQIESLVAYTRALGQ